MDTVFMLIFAFSALALIVFVVSTLFPLKFLGLHTRKKSALFALGAFFVCIAAVTISVVTTSPEQRAARLAEIEQRQAEREKAEIEEAEMAAAREVDAVDQQELSEPEIDVVDAAPEPEVSSESDTTTPDSNNRSLLSVLFGSGETPEEKAQREAREAQESAEREARNAENHYKGFHCLRLRDGSHRGFVRLVEDQLVDPDSFEHIETRVSPMIEVVGSDVFGTHAINMRFRAKNSFGGYVINTAFGRYQNEGCDPVLEEIK